MQSNKHTTRFSLLRLLCFTGLVGVLVLAIGAVPPPADAASIFYETFAYDLGRLNEQGGWSSSAFANVIARGLSYHAGGVRADGEDRALVLSTNNNNNATHPLSFSGDELYVSFLLRQGSGFVNAGDTALLWFGSDNGPAIGMKIDHAGGADLVARAAPGQEVAAGSLSWGETVLVVGHLYASTPGGNYDRFELWVNPGPNDQDAPDSTSSGDSGIDSFANIGFATINLEHWSNNADGIIFDALSIGTTWADVVIDDSIPPDVIEPPPNHQAPEPISIPLATNEPVNSVWPAAPQNQSGIPLQSAPAWLPIISTDPDGVYLLPEAPLGYRYSHSASVGHGLYRITNDLPEGGVELCILKSNEGGDLQVMAAYYGVPERWHLLPSTERRNDNGVIVCAVIDRPMYFALLSPTTTP